MRVHDQESWSVSLGQWGPVRVRLHISFLLFAAVTLYLSCQPAGDLDTYRFDWMAPLSLGLLLLSVLLHELAHCYAADRLGGAMVSSVLVPWGGMSGYHLPRDARTELLVHLAGPAANGLLCLMCVPLLIAAEDASVLALLHPLRPDQIDQGSASLVAVKLTFWINWLLLLVNLVPAFPFDGGKVFRAALAPLVGRRFAAVVVGRLAQVAAVLLLLAAWMTRDMPNGGMVPVWFALLLLAIVLFFSATQEPERREREAGEDELFGYDFSQGYTSLEQSDDVVEDEPANPLAQWLRRRSEERQRRQREREAEEERRVDEILARLHQFGMQSLSAADRALLKRVSQRYRNRLSDRR